MFKWLCRGILLPLLLAQAAQAATCPPYPYTLTNGMPTDATQVMADFSGILTCANNSLAPIANPSFTGNVGIGTTTPAALLEMSGTASNTYAPINMSAGAGPTIRNENTNTTTNNVSRLIFATNDLSGTIIGAAAITAIFTSHTTGAVSTDLAFQTRNVGTVGEVMRLSASGNVGIGTSTPGYALQVNGSAAGSSAWINLSDGRLKKNVESISGALSLVRRLRGVRFEWLPVDESNPEAGQAPTPTPDGKHLGFIAQEVEAVVPEAVVAPDKGSNRMYYGLKESDLIPILVEAVKEQQTQIEQLRATVSALKRGSP